MSIFLLSSDAFHLVQEYLEATDSCRLGFASRSLLETCRCDRIWKKYCMESLGIDVDRYNENKAVKKEAWKIFKETSSMTAGWEGYIVVQRDESGEDFVRQHPTLSGYYNFSSLRVKPIGIRVNITSKIKNNRIMLSGIIQYLEPKIPVSEMTPLEKAFHAITLSASCDESQQCNVLEEHPIAGELLPGGKISIQECGTILKLSGTRIANRGIVGTHNFGCFYLMLRSADRTYQHVTKDSYWEGVCIQRDWIEEEYPMTMTIDQVSDSYGAVHGEISFPTLDNETRYAGVYAVIEESPNEQLLSPSISSKPGSPPPPLCTLFSDQAPLRAPASPKGTKFLFSEYQYIRKGSSVVPTHYNAEVSGDLMIGIYHDSRVYNYGTFAMRQISKSQSVHLDPCSGVY